MTLSVIVAVLIVVLFPVEPVRRRSFLVRPKGVPSPERIERPVAQRLHAGVSSVEIRHLAITQPSKRARNLFSSRSRLETGA